MNYTCTLETLIQTGPSNMAIMAVRWASRLCWLSTATLLEKLPYRLGRRRDAS